ncbi:MAG: hypothetical protein ACRDT0_26475 [Pseudonocardiaceae bacterium]
MSVQPLPWPDRRRRWWLRCGRPGSRRCRESMRACLEAVSAVAPDWLAAVIDLPGWGRRYGARVDTWRLPASSAKRAELVAADGADALLLRAIHDGGAPVWRLALSAVEVLRVVVLVQNYVRRWSGCRPAPPRHRRPGGDSISARFVDA